MRLKTFYFCPLRGRGSLSATTPSKLQPLRDEAEDTEGRPFALDWGLAQGGLLQGKWRILAILTLLPTKLLQRGNDSALSAPAAERSIAAMTGIGPAGFAPRFANRIADEAEHTERHGASRASTKFGGASSCKSGISCTARAVTSSPSVSLQPSRMRPGCLRKKGSAHWWSRIRAAR